MKVLHVLHHSIPYLDGYAIRSQYIVEHQQKHGITPQVLTSSANSYSDNDGAVYNGITYYRTVCAQPSVIGKLPFIKEQRVIRAITKKIKELCSRTDYDIIHAHSPVLCGIAALKAARSLGIPVLYEQRGVWEDSAVARGQYRRKSLKYRMARYLETQLCKDVDGIVTISSHMVTELVARGISKEKISLIPNGVDIEKFSPDKAVKAQDGSTVIGYIGSIEKLEGLDTLIRAIPQIVSKNKNVTFLIVGGGRQLENIKELAEKLDISSYLEITGQVPHEKILEYYKRLDILVYPRIDSKVTQMVTPLKPLEAMALGKLVVGSDVGGISELIQDGTTGCLFQPGSHQSLTDMLTCLIENRSKREQIIENGCSYIKQTRDWSIITADYSDIYRSIKQ